MDFLNTIRVLVEELIENPKIHATGNERREKLEATLRAAVIQSNLAKKQELGLDFGPFGQIIFPYNKFGTIDSLDLFGFDEIVLLAYYLRQKERVHRTLDLGANIGLHSLIMSKLGFEVESYEPDPDHAEIFTNVMRLNKVSPLLHRKAVSDHSGTASFTRVVGNTTGSHLTGCKANPYGELDIFEVEVLDVRQILNQIQLVKMDVEGNELSCIRCLENFHFTDCDFLVEVGSPENARGILNHLKSIEVSCFSQKSGWERVVDLSQMPVSHREGSIFVSTKDSMGW